MGLIQASRREGEQGSEWKKGKEDIGDKKRIGTEKSRRVN